MQKSKPMLMGWYVIIDGEEFKAYVIMENWDGDVNSNLFKRSVELLNDQQKRTIVELFKGSDEQ